MYLEQSRQEAEIAARQHVTQVEQLRAESAATQAQLREEIQRLEQLSQHVSTELEQGTGGGSGNETSSLSMF